MKPILPRPLRQRQGFSLIEAAIVLALVGVVIGGIWAAASTVSESHRISDTLEGIASLLGNLRQNYEGQDLAQLETDVIYFTEDSTVFSNVVGFTYTSTFNVKDAWGKDVGGYFEADGFDLIFYELNKSACMKIISKFSGMAKEMVNIQTPGGVYNTSANQLPFTPVASVDCPTQANRVELYFTR